MSQGLTPLDQTSWDEVEKIVEEEFFTTDDVYQLLQKRKDGTVKQGIENFYIVLQRIRSSEVRSEEMT